MAKRKPLGNRIAPPRFLIALAAMIAGAGALLAAGWAPNEAAMAGFDLAAAIFLVSLITLGRDTGADAMRGAALANDANRGALLAISAVVALAVLAAVAAELGPSLAAWQVALIVATLALAWGFANSVFALHYAHLYYQRAAHDGDGAGLDFPGTHEPGYANFVYFAFTLGMTFQTSDVSITTARMRKLVTFHSLVAFVFNLGVLALTVNVLGSLGR